MKKKILRFLGVAGLLLFTLRDGYAGDKAELNFAECVTLASGYSDLLRIQSRRKEQARERLAQSKGGLRPEVSYEYSGLLRDSAGGLYSKSGKDSRLSLSQPLYHGSRKKETVLFSDAEIKREEFQYEEFLRLLSADVARAFYSAVQFEKDIEDLEISLSLMRERLKELERRVRLGKSRESEVLALESQIATFEAQKEKSRGDRDKALETLSRLTGRDPARMILRDDTPLPEEAGLLEEYLKGIETRPDIRLYEQEIIAQGANVRIAYGERLPELNLGGSWYFTRNESLHSSDWDMVLSLDFPLFQGGILRSRVKEEVLLKKEIEENRSLILRDADAEIRKLHKALVSTLNQTRALKDAYEKSQKSYELQLRDYGLGLVNNLDLIQAMTTLSDTKRNLDKALIQTKMDKALLDIASVR